MPSIGNSVTRYGPFRSLCQNPRCAVTVRASVSANAAVSNDQAPRTAKLSVPPRHGTPIDRDVGAAQDGALDYVGHGFGARPVEIGGDGPAFSYRAPFEGCGP